MLGETATLLAWLQNGRAGEPHAVSDAKVRRLEAAWRTDGVVPVDDPEP